jgi:tyramine---L-glutamate ligase
MAGALLEDLLQLPGIEVSYARNARLAPLARPRPGMARVCWREPGADPRAALAREIGEADAVWPIAPESGGVLQRAAQAVIDAGRVLIGAHPSAIALAASKYGTSRRLRAEGIAAVPGFRAGERTAAAAAAGEGAWVVKPDDGAGCLQMRVFDGRAAALAALDALGAGFVAQPWIEGPAMSLAAIGGADGVQLLSVNRQQVEARDGWLALRAVDVNVVPACAELASLAARVAAAVPGLSGYFGIDYIDGASGPVVIEVNPRLTTTYAGLRPALGINAAQRVLVAAGICPAPSTAQESSGRGRPVRLRLSRTGWDGEAGRG